MATGIATASETRRRTIGAWEVVHRVADPDREVYVAKHPERGETAVLVVVQAEGDAATKLRNEAERCRMLDHGAIARIRDVFEDGGKQIVAFEHVDGTSLHRLMKHFEEKNEGLGDRAVLHIGVLLLEALSAAHQARTDDGKAAPIVHGQLGPHQVMISWEGAAKLMGFGLTAAFGGKDDEPSWLMPYTAPETRDGSLITVRANVYTAGAMLWTLFSRRPLPPDGSRPPALRRMRPDLPASVTFPIDRAMEPAQKRISAKALAVSLSRTLEEADREELRWAMEVARVRCTVEDEFLPQESFPPRKTRSLRAKGSSLPPDSDRPTAKMESTLLLEQARLLGPLPWDVPTKEKPAPEEVTILEDDDDDEEGTETIMAPSAEPSTTKKAPRPTSRRTLGVKKRRSRRFPRSESPESAEPSTQPKAEKEVPRLGLRAPRPRMNTKIGMHAEQEHQVTLPAPRRASQGAGDSGAPTSGRHISGHPISGRPGEDPHAWAEQSYAGVPSVAVPPAGAPYPSSPPHPSAGPSQSQGPHPSYGASPSAHAYPPSYFPQSQAVPPGHVVVPSQLAAGLMSSLYAPSQMAPTPGTTGGPVTRWVAAVAVVAVASFAAGLLIASGGGVQVKVPEPVVTQQPASVPTPSNPPAPAPSPSKAEPAPEPKAPVPEPAPEPEPEKQPEPETVVTPEPIVREPSALPLNMGLLLVSTTVADAVVYVSGRAAGPAGKRLEVTCGPHHIRLGDEGRTIWYEPGQSVTLGCRALNEMIIEPRAEPPPPRRMPWPPETKPKPKPKGKAKGTPRFTRD